MAHFWTTYPERIKKFGLEAIFNVYQLFTTKVGVLSNLEQHCNIATQPRVRSEAFSHGDKELISWKVCCVDWYIVQGLYYQPLHGPEDGNTILFQNVTIYKFTWSKSFSFFLKKL